MEYLLRLRDFTPPLTDAVLHSIFDNDGCAYLRAADVEREDRPC